MSYCAVEAVRSYEKRCRVGSTVDQEAHTLAGFGLDTREFRVVFDVYTTLSEYQLHLIQQKLPPDPVIMVAIQLLGRNDDFTYSVVVTIFERTVSRDPTFVLDPVENTKTVEDMKTIWREDDA